MKKYLIKLAGHLDEKGLYKEADYVDWILKKADDYTYTYSKGKLIRLKESQISDPKLIQIAKLSQKLMSLLDNSKYNIGSKRIVIKSSEVNQTNENSATATSNEIIYYGYDQTKPKKPKSKLRHNPFGETFE